MYEKASVKGVSYKNVEMIISIQTGFNGQKLVFYILNVFAVLDIMLYLIPASHPLPPKLHSLHQ